MSADASDSSSPDSRRLSAGEVRDLDEVRQAIGELGQAELGRLIIAARTLLRGFQIDPQKRDPKDLLSTAITRTLSGERQWRRPVQLSRHLFRVMRSLASHWRRQAAGGRDTVSLTDLESLDDHRALRDPRPNPERTMIIRETLEAIWRHFANDEAARAVLASMAKGMTGPTIRRVTGMTQRQFATTVERIRRYARRGKYDDA